MAGASMLMMGAMSAWAESVTVDGMDCTYTLNRSASTAIAMTKTVPANSNFISVELEGYSLNNNSEKLVTRAQASSYSGDMELSVKVSKDTYGFNFIGAYSVHRVNSWTGKLRK